MKYGSILRDHQNDYKLVDSLLCTGRYGIYFLFFIKVCELLFTASPSSVTNFDTLVYTLGQKFSNLILDVSNLQIDLFGLLQKNGIL